jgi:hypothetical protein
MINPTGKGIPNVWSFLDQNYIGKLSDQAGQRLRSFHDHWHYLDQLVGLKIVPVDQHDERHPSKIGKDGRRHYLIRAIPYQDPKRETERLKAVHEAWVKIVPRV